ncbi:MAG: HAMP domain-containing histidine kinase, partial [Promicromonosporaceae bacterium]|nr:HAMP domain-containing histidine kinase [Promicromonosporaceae bacterium]
MRRRILRATIAALAVVVALLAIPLSVFGANWVMDQEVRSIEGRLDPLTSAVQQAQDLVAAHYEDPAGAPDIIELLPERVFTRAVEGTWGGETPAFVSVVLPDGRSITRGEPISGPSIDRATTTESRAFISIEVSAWPARIRAGQVVAVIAVGCLVALGAGALVARVIANRLTKPLVMLAATAEQLGSGQTKSALAPTGIEEIDLVASELQRTSERLAGHLASARKFTADASHQMRTPLTALSMRLEEIELMSDEAEVREEARVSLDQVERLVSVIDDLLAASKHTQGGTTEPVNLVDVAAQQVAEWGPTFERAGRAVLADVAADARVLAT